MNTTKLSKHKPFTLKEQDIFHRIMSIIKDTIHPEQIFLNTYEQNAKVFYEFTILTSKKAKTKLLEKSLQNTAANKNFSVEMISEKLTEIKKFTGGKSGYVTCPFDRISMVPEKSIAVALEIEALYYFGLVISFSKNQVYNLKDQAYFDFFKNKQIYEKVSFFHNTMLRILNSFNLSYLSKRQAENNKEFIQLLVKALDDPNKKYRIKPISKNLSSNESPDPMITGDHNKELIDHLDFINKMIEKKAASLEMLIEDYYNRFPMNAHTN